MTRLAGFSFAMLSVAAYGQTLMHGISTNEPLQLLPGDAAILEDAEMRSDLPCTVKPISPQLGFDLRFHAGYDVTIPLQNMAGQGDDLTAIFRVIPDDHPEAPVYFSQKWSVPPMSDHARGRAELHGAFMLGEGKYRVKWLLRDGLERICSSRWQIAVDPRGSYKQLLPGIARSRVEPEQTNPFTAEAPVKRDDSQALNILVLLHVAPESAAAVSMRESDTLALLSILRRIAQEPRIGSYSIVAFNLDRNSVLYRRDDVPQLDFPALGDAFQQLHLGTVEFKRLQAKEKKADFLAGILKDEIARRAPDALIFVGPRTALDFDEHRPKKDLAEPRCPVFYLTYTPDPVHNPWRDFIGNLVKVWKGSEFVISKPPDLFKAWTEVMSHLPNRNPQAASSEPASAINPLFPGKF